MFLVEYIKQFRSCLKKSIGDLSYGNQITKVTLVSLGSHPKLKLTTLSDEMLQITGWHQQRRSCVNSVGYRWDDTAKLLHLCFVYFTSATKMLSSVTKEGVAHFKTLHPDKWVISLDLLALVFPHRAEANIYGPRRSSAVWFYTLYIMLIHPECSTRSPPPCSNPVTRLSLTRQRSWGVGHDFWNGVQSL